MNAWWEQLNPGERRTLIIGGGVLVIALLYALLWRPLHMNVEKMRGQVQEHKTLVAWMQSAAAEATVLMSSSQRTTPNRGTQSLMSVVDQTAKREKLGSALKRVEPKGADEVRVRLENASFDDLVSWLAVLRTRFNVDVDSFSAERIDDGLVNASVTLTEGGV